MATDHFSELGADMLADLPDDEVYDDLGEEAMEGVALHFYEAGRAFAQAEIRQELLAEAERLEGKPASWSPAAEALRTFAAGMSPKADG